MESFGHFTSFFLMITQIYGSTTTKLMKDILSTNKKLASLRSRKQFLLDCRKFSVHPKSLNVNLKSFKFCLSANAIMSQSEKFSKSILNESIRNIHRDIHNAYKRSCELANELKLLVSSNMFDDFKSNVKRTYDGTYRKFANDQCKRLDKLLDPFVSKLNIDCDFWIKNLSSVTIPSNVKYILALGDKFNLPTKVKYVNTNQIIANLEPTIKQFGDSTKFELRNKICNIITNFKKAPVQFTTIDALLNVFHLATQSFMKDHPDLLVLNADKSKVTVLMDKKDYVSKINALLADTKTYLKLNRGDPTLCVQRKCNTIISRWQKSNYITAGQAWFLRRYNAVCSKLYGLVKVHKSGFPIRPIVASIDSATYNLSKMYSDILKNVTGKTNRSVLNSTELVKKLRRVRLPENYKLISLDVVSLFTNIPSELVISAIHRKWPKIQKFTTLPKHEFIAGLNLVLDECCFQFDGTFYKQIFGSPMGSPASPVFADIILEILEEEVIKKLGFKLPFYYRYVDDILTAVPADKILETRLAFCNYNPNIQFTVEEEDNNQCISFLEVLCIRVDRSIKTDWFHKTTWSGRYLNFLSNLPITYKRNTVSLLATKILTLSEPEFHAKNFELLRATLKRNLYPKRLVDNIIDNTKMKFRNGTQTLPSTEVRPMVAIPYCKGLFERLKSACKDEIILVGKADNFVKKSVFSKIKDKTPILKQSNLVYLVTCECGVKYVGETLQLLESRLKQHKCGIKKKDEGYSSLVQHCVQTNHVPLWDDVKVLQREKVTNRREVLESIHIKKTVNCINTQKESIYLASTYNNVI